MDIQLPLPSNEQDPFQREVRRFGRELLDALEVPLTSGILLKDIDVSASPVTVDHRLGYEPTGFFIVNSDEDVRVWRSGKANTRSITLIASATATVTLWVF
jgi:hypothetical protein